MFRSLHLLSSSLLSPQSLAPSHTQRLGMQRWLVHSNWAAEQNSSGEKLRKNKTQLIFLGISLKNKQKKSQGVCVAGPAGASLGVLAGRRTTVGLVCTVLTVILVVARPAHGNATAAGTSKEGCRTLCFAAPLKRETKEDQLEERIIMDILLFLC